MATVNSIYYNAPGKQLFIDNNTNQFVISGYRLAVDPTLNRDLLLVQVPDTTGDIGMQGNIAFDEHHIYYCVSTNRWVRARLANWDSTEDISPAAPSEITTPTNWWNFTSNGNSILGNYNFTPKGTVNFNSTNGFTNPIVEGCLLNYTSNLIEPSVSNIDFSISFEVKRLNNGFLMGNPFGKLGFHFQFVNPSNTAYGPYLSFSLGTHGPFFNYSWVTAISSSQISTSEFTQVVATNDAANKIIKLYINGVFETSTSYLGGNPLGSIYNNPSYQGWGIGASPNGSAYGNPVNQTEYYSSSNVRYMGFWKGTALNAPQVLALYNGGDFRRYPFV